MSTIKQFWLAFVAACFLAAFAGGAVAEAPQAKVKAGMALLKEKLAAYGKPPLEGTNLLFGEHKVNEEVAAVDAVKEALGVNATVFMKQDANFIRISTNVIRDGNRALGTELDPNGPGYPRVSQGESYYGQAEFRLCGTCMDARGMTEAEISQGAKRSTLAHLADWTATANKVLVV